MARMCLLAGIVMVVMVVGDRGDLGQAETRFFKLSVTQSVQRIQRYFFGIHRFW
jgi:hypothetical protein